MIFLNCFAEYFLFYFIFRDKSKEVGNKCSTITKDDARAI